MILNCRELTRTLASDELVEASLLHRFEARLHLLMCRHCRRFAAQLEAIGSAARTSWGAESQSEVQLEQLESRILGVVRRGERHGGQWVPTARSSPAVRMVIEPPTADASTCTLLGERVGDSQSLNRACAFGHPGEQRALLPSEGNSLASTPSAVASCSVLANIFRMRRLRSTQPSGLFLPLMSLAIISNPP